MRTMSALFFSIATTCCLLSSPLQASKITRTNDDPVVQDLDQADLLASILYFSFNYVEDRIPNLGELKTDMLAGSVIQMLAEGSGLKFGDSPAAGAVFRDLVKSITVVKKAYDGTEVGGTGVKYDIANIEAAVLKPLIKGGVIAALIKAGFEAKQAAEISNFIGDIPARALVLIGQNHQRSKSTEPFHSYLLRTLSSDLFVSATLQTVPKNMVVWVISKMIAKLKIGTAVDSLWFNKLPSLLTKTRRVGAEAGTEVLSVLNKKDGIFAHYKRLREAGAFGAIVLAPLIPYGAVAVTTLINTYLLATPSRIVMDGVNDLYAGLGVVCSWLLPEAPSVAPLEELQPSGFEEAYKDEL